MNDNEAKRQIEQMKKFILQEAKEKADELDIRTAKDYIAQKLHLFTQEKVKVENEFEKGLQQLDVQQRISRSQTVTKSRMDKMRLRDNLINQALTIASEKLAKVSKHPNYSRVMKALILQGCLRLHDTNVVIRCRHEDVNLVRSILKDCEKEYTQVFKKLCGFENETVSLSIDEKQYLPPAPVPGSDVLSCTGGVALHSHNGNILLDNTFERRLELSFEGLKPQIRQTMFGEFERR